MSHHRETKILVGHTRQWQEFVMSFNSGKLHHAWLLVGEKGIGKSTFAYQAAKFLMKDSKSFNSSNVEKKIENLSHPDLYVLDAESVDENSISTGIKVDAIRALQDFIVLTPALSNYKVIIIDDINLLNLNASNALLKFLEEPTPNTIFFLVCHAQGGVLPTIRSRCRILKFNNLSFQDFQQIYLNHHSAFDMDDLRKLYEVSFGSLSYAQLFNSKQAITIYDKIKLMLLDGWTNQDVLELTQLINDDENWEIIKYAIEANLFGIIKEMSINEDELKVKNKISYYERINRILHDTKKFHLEKSSVIHAVFG